LVEEHLIRSSGLDKEPSVTEGGRIAHKLLSRQHLMIRSSGFNKEPLVIEGAMIAHKLLSRQYLIRSRFGEET
jgi:hypothetical protein